MSNIETIPPGKSFYWSRYLTDHSLISAPVWLLRLLEYEDENEEKWLILVKSTRVKGAFERVALWYLAGPNWKRGFEYDQGSYPELVNIWYKMNEIIIV
jgi:hypothetical protein